MNPYIAFRTSVVAAPLIDALAVIYMMSATPSFTQDWQDLLAWSGDGGILTDEEELAPKDIVMIIVILVYALIALGNQIALFFYWKPSRTIYIILTILGLLATPFLGLTVAPPLEMLGHELSLYISGATLALAYFSPVSERFK